METSHRIISGDSRTTTPSEAVDLVVTSPPYPMISMWDSVFSELNPQIEKALDKNDGDEAFELMHTELDKVWENIAESIGEGGFVCINIGDATRKVDDDFQVYPNHSRIIDKFRDMGFSMLPDILWRKPSNKQNKFMGSGMMPPNAYVTLEHEYILVFRKGGTRNFDSTDVRYESAYFWEERNDWFSDVWTGLTGVSQSMEATSRDRSAAFPLELPYRLINMFSVHGDTVYDPFWGTGTTTIAAMITGRNSVGVEIEEELIEKFDADISEIPTISTDRLQKRVQNHKEFIASIEESVPTENHSFSVKTKQEADILLYEVQSVEKIDGEYIVSYEPYSHASN